jgi:hypothetical protein
LKPQRKRAKVEPQVANVSAMPVPDEHTFEQMLEAASMLQQQSRRSGKHLDPAATLLEIAEAQSLLRSLSDVSAAAKVIAERLERITSASAIAVAFLRNEQLEYCAAAGTSASLAGSTVPTPANIAELLRKAKARDASSNDLRRKYLQGDTPNPILFPFYDKTAMVGFLQLNFPETESIAAHETQSCQVMANLMGEAVARANELQWKHALAKEHAAVLEALERLKPQLERLTEDSLATNPEAAETMPEPSSGPGVETKQQLLGELSPEALPDISDLLAQLTDEPASRTASGTQAGSVPLKDEAKVAGSSLAAVPESARAANPASEELTCQLSSACQQCGFQFAEGESFCGRCGTPRSMEYTPRRDELAPEPQTIGEHGDEPRCGGKFLLEGEVSPAIPVPIPLVFQAGASEGIPAVDGTAALALDPVAPKAEKAEAEPENQMRILLEHEKSAWQSPWTSAAKARSWLESFGQGPSPAKYWLAKHPGDVSVAIAVLVLLLAILWWTPHQAPPRPRRKSPEASLTLFERALVELGLAEPPAVSAGYAGNPKSSVWEDVHTALYYCSGSERYGKTEGGKIASQREAQLDQFQPAGNKPCE